MMHLSIKKKGNGNMKRIISILCAFTLVFAMAGCQQQADTADYSNTTLTGKVTSIDGTTVTLQLGELTQMDRTMFEGQEPPEGEFAQRPDGSKGERTPPEMPSGEPGGEMDGNRPEIPSGEIRPDRSDGEQGDFGGFGGGMSSFTAGEETATIDLAGAVVTVGSMRENTEGSISDIAVGDVLIVEVGENNCVTAVTIQFIPNFDAEMGEMGRPNGDFGGSMEVTQGTSANTIDADGTYADTTYTSTGDDENALRVTGAAVTLEGITVNKESGATSNTENGDFYGMNAALLATDGANVTINAITVNSSAQNGNGVFSYGEGTVVNISDSVITTTADNSGGIQTTGGGTTNATDLNITTYGNSSAAIRSDRGGGTVNVDGGSYTSNGYNSPAVYSTAAITVKNAILTANNSEALVIEGKNSMTLEDCTVTGNMSDTDGSSSDINVHNVMIYQSMSGDADVGTSEFSMTGGSLASKNGDLFYVTNTHCIMSLSNVQIMNLETDGYFLLVSGNNASHGWGQAGANGAQAEFTADGQTFDGNIAVDTISTLAMMLTNGSGFTGTVNILANEQNGTPVENNAVITIDSGCTWTLTGDCTVTSLTNRGTINFNGFSITLADGTVLTN